MFLQHLANLQNAPGPIEVATSTPVVSDAPPAWSARPAAVGVGSVPAAYGAASLVVAVVEPAARPTAAWTGSDGLPGWSGVLFDGSSAPGTAPGMIADDLRPEMSADGGSDVLVGGSGGDGRDLVIGGLAVSRAATTASQDVVSAVHQRDASWAARDTLMAGDWAVEESWLSATSTTPSTLNTMVFARRDEYFIDTCDSNAGDAW